MRTGPSGLLLEEAQTDCPPSPCGPGASRRSYGRWVSPWGPSSSPPHPRVVGMLVLHARADEEGQPLPVTMQVSFTNSHHVGPPYFSSFPVTPLPELLQARGARLRSLRHEGRAAV